MEIPPVQRQQDSFFINDYQSRVDHDQLNLLSTLFLVYAVLAFLGSLGAVAYGLMFSTMFSNPQAFGARPNDGPPMAFFGIFAVFIFVGFVIAVAMGALSLFASKCLRDRKNWTWIMVAACLDCLHMPLGTGLGVFALIVLNRPSVKALFTS